MTRNAFFLKKNVLGLVILLHFSPIKLKSQLFCLYILSSVTENKNFQKEFGFVCVFFLRSVDTEKKIDTEGMSKM